MASNSTVHFKVFLRDGDNVEARRFIIEDASVVTSLLFMKEKLQVIFPVLRNCSFRITWKDNDGDEITVANDDDLITAFTEMASNVKSLYITVVEKNEPAFESEDEPIIEMEIGDGPRIICDACETIVTGFRYKCMQCPDYDLCAACENKGLHSEHIMMRSSNTNVFVNRCARRIMGQVSRTLRKAHYAAAKEAARGSKQKNQKECKKECEEGNDDTRGRHHHGGHHRGHHGGMGPHCTLPNLQQIHSFVAPILGAALSGVSHLASQAAQATQGPQATAQETQQEKSSTTSNTQMPQTPLLDNPLGNLVQMAVSDFFAAMNNAQSNSSQQNTQTEPTKPQESGKAQESGKPQESVKTQEFGKPQEQSGQGTTVPNVTPIFTPGPSGAATPNSQPAKLYPEVPKNNTTNPLEFLLNPNLFRTTFSAPMEVEKENDFEHQNQSQQNQSQQNQSQQNLTQQKESEQKDSQQKESQQKEPQQKVGFLQSVLPQQNEASGFSLSRALGGYSDLAAAAVGSQAANFIRTEANESQEPGWTLVGQSTKPSADVKPKVSEESIKVAEGLKQLLEMGFNDELNLVALLKRYEGNVGLVVKHLFENPLA